MRSFLLASILLLIYSNLNSQLALVPDSAAYTRCVQENVKVKFKLANDTSRTIYTWWEQRGIMKDPRNDWRVKIRNTSRNGIPYPLADTDYRPKKYIIESIRGTPHWYPIEIGQTLNLGSTYFDRFITAENPGKYSFEIGFRYNWGDTLEFVPAGSPDFSWGEVDTTWATIHINFKECPDSTYIAEANNRWSQWLANPKEHSHLAYCEKSPHITLVDSIIALFEKSDPILRTKSGLLLTRFIGGKSLTKIQCKRLFSGVANYSFANKKQVPQDISLDYYRNRFFAHIVHNTPAEGFEYALKFRNDLSPEIRSNVLYIAYKYNHISIVQSFMLDSDRDVRKKAKIYLKRIKIGMYPR